MPRSGDGAYALPGGTIVQTGDTILPSQHNPAMQDIASALTGSLDRDGNGGMRANLAMGTHRITGLSAGIDPTDAATVSQVTGGAGVPVGCIMDFAGSAAPDGWLLCGGQAISRTTYSDLFTAIGTTYGVGDGTTTFNIPDCRGRTSAGRDFDQGGNAGRLTSTTMSPDGTTLGATGGAQTVTLTTDQMPSHEHTLSGSTNSAGTHEHSINAGASNPSGDGFARGAETASNSTNSAGSHSHTLSGSAAATGGGQAHGNVQPTILFNKIIRASAT